MLIWTTLGHFWTILGTFGRLFSGYGRGGQTRCTSKTKGPREKLSTQKLFVVKSWMRKSALGFGLGPSVQPETEQEFRTVGPYKMEVN